MSGTNWENVDELGGHDGDTTTVSSSIAGDKDLYSVSTFPGGISAIAGLFVTGFGRSDESAQASARLKVKSGNTEAEGATKLFTGAAYKSFSASFPVNPDTTLPWTNSDVVQVGVEIT